MKRISILFAVALLLGACSRNNVTVEFNNSKCLRETKADEDYGEIVKSWTITLKHTDAGLLITRTNAWMSCGQILSELSVQNGIIHYRTYPKYLTDCVCPYNLWAQVGGLQENTEYTLEYSCEGFVFLPITFYYAPGLDVTFDLRLYTE